MAGVEQRSPLHHNFPVPKLPAHVPVAVKDLEDKVTEHAVEVKQFHKKAKERHEKQINALNQKIQSDHQRLVELFKRINRHERRAHRERQPHPLPHRSCKIPPGPGQKYLK